MKTTKKPFDIKKNLDLIGKTFKVLDTRERKILRLYNGLEDGTQHNMAEISRMENVTRERIRQIMTKAYNKIDTILKYEE
jgi:RNA polymerase primary sigma factor